MIVVPGLEISTTLDWRALPPKESTTVLHYPAKGGVQHHMDWPNRPLIVDRVAALANAYESARRCQRDHQGQGWIDTGQHYSVWREGIITEGRTGSLSTSYSGKSVIKGAHAADQDKKPPVWCNDWIGIEHEGTYITEAMPEPQWRASVFLNAWLALVYKWDALDPNFIKGHLDTGCGTLCPGNWFHSQLPRLRQEVHEKKLAIIATLKANKKAEG